MTACLPLLLAVLTATTPKSAQITGRTADFDRQEGVALFEGDVRVTYSDGSVMGADRLFLFATGTNELSRVVAIGHVVLTNGVRSGSCGMAVYRRRKGEIEMFADGTNAPARLVEAGVRTNVLAGARIRYWLDSEQVEVERAQIDAETRGVGKELK